MVITTE